MPQATCSSVNAMCWLLLSEAGWRHEPRIGLSHINEILRFSLITYTITGGMNRIKAKRKESELTAQLTTKVERIRKEED